TFTSVALSPASKNSTLPWFSMFDPGNDLHASLLPGSSSEISLCQLTLPIFPGSWATQSEVVLSSSVTFSRWAINSGRLSNLLQKSYTSVLGRCTIRLVCMLTLLLRGLTSLLPTAVYKGQ